MAPVAIILGIFFILGIAVGVITVIALSALRRYEEPSPDGWPDLDQESSDDLAPDSGWDDAPDDGPSWPKSREGG
jgi:hypothetical protein